MARAWLSWSSGKDSAFALEELRRSGRLEVVGLLTTVNSAADRVAMHAVRRELVEAQADRLGVPLHVVEIPDPCPNEVYAERMGEAMSDAAADGVDHVVFGDLHLADVRAYRERMLEDCPVTPVFPLWGRPTGQLAEEMLASGIRATITCVDPSQVPSGLAGRSWDERLLAELPEAADPCGENGEFHTFVWDAPQFESPVEVGTGEVVERGGFVFCDLLPAGG